MCLKEMSKKQKTLFESWNRNASKSTTSQNIPKQTGINSLPSCSSYASPSHNLFQHHVFSNSTNRLVDKGFDYEAGKTWVYPTNYPVRDYQFAIVKEALFKNTLVILPTGLGKTFIAAVVMYNIYRWYPSGKIIFMAPTRPLVAQQIDACYKVTGISHADTTQMTGTNQPEERKRMWMKKRVFYLTPQVLVNDLARNICPAESIKCLVVDEAHKALGNHAYCQVIKELQAYTTHFRILALTATPGSDTQAVKLLLSNLLISHVEMRTEDSDDVKPYTHIRNIEKIVVPLGDRLLSIKSRFLDIINVYLKRLTQRRAMTAKNPSSLSKFQVLRMRDDFSQHPPSNIDKFAYGLIMADFSLCISLYHAYELLLLHGARSFYNFLTGIINGEKSIPHARSELQKNYDFDVLLKEIQENYIVENIESNQIMASNIDGKKPGHPKLEKLLEVVLQHFNYVNKGKDTRVMIFSQYRDSVQEITAMLNHYKPMIKAMSFIGQASKSATNAGFSQKQQLKVLQQFRSGGYNTLVSTCVGEEGLDIGEVDLIVCYDCPKSPIRLVQRMGRTGRLRGGKIIILIAEGKEEQMYNSCESKKKSVHRAISKGFAFAQLYNNSPSLLPPGVKPVCVKTVVTVETQKVLFKSKGKSKEDGFLNEDELNEFKECFEIPKSEYPLLQKSEIVCLKGFQAQENKNAQGTTPDKIHQSDPPVLSLSNWLLWQTTPQRTHMISHSSKTLLLTETIEKINFSIERGLENVIGENTMCPSEPLNSISMKNLSPPLVDLCDEENIAYDFNEALPLEKNDFAQYSVGGNSPNSPENIKGNLLKRMFGIPSIKLPAEFHNQDIIPPPVISNSGIISTVSFESTTLNKSKSCLILNILNKKMKARLKRKTKELGINFSFGANLEFSYKKSPITTSAVHLSESKDDNLEISLNVHKANKISNFKNDKLDETVLPECITFDIDFDAPQTMDEDNCILIADKGHLSEAVVSDNQKNIKQTIETNLKGSFDIPQLMDELIHPHVTDQGDCRAVDAAMKESEIIAIAINNQNNNQTMTTNLKESFYIDFDATQNIYNDNRFQITSKEDFPQTTIPENHQNIAQTTANNFKKSFDIDFNASQDINEFNCHQVLDEDNLHQPVDADIPKHSDILQNINSAVSTDRKRSEQNYLKNQKDKTSIQSLDADSSEILQQFFTDKEDIVKKVDSSFTLPLTVKKVIFDESNETPKSAQSRRSVLKDKNISILRSYNYKFKRLGNVSTHSNQPCEVKQENDTFESLNINKINSVDNPVNLTKTSTENEFSQYSLTQLLSLIDSTESNEVTVYNKNSDYLLEVPKQSTPKKNMSSDDEIEPTPPKGIIPSTTKFFYRSNSFNLDSDSTNKKNTLKDKLEMLSYPSASLDILSTHHLSDMQSPIKHELNITTNKNPVFSSSLTRHTLNTDQNDAEERNYEKSKIAFSKDDLSKKKLNKLFPSEDQQSKLYNDQLPAKRQNLSEMQNVSSPKNYESNISFDLFGIDSPNSENSKKTYQPFENNNRPNKICQNKQSESHTCSSSPINVKGKSLFDFSDVKVTEGSNTKIEHSVIRKTNCKDEDQLIERNITGNQTNPLSEISFDLSDIQFPQLDNTNNNYVAKSFIKPKSPSPVKISDVDKDEHCSVFESAAAENIFFDISFDFPDLQESSPQKEVLIKQDDNITENISSDTSKGWSPNYKSAISVNCVSKNQSTSQVNNNKSEAVSNHATCFEDSKSKSVLGTQNSKNSKASNKVLLNKYIENDFDLSNLEDFIMPQKLNCKRIKISSPETNEKQCLGVKNSNPKNSKPETLFKTSKHQQKENTSSECSSNKSEMNNFKKPFSKLSRAGTSSIKHDKKNLHNKKVFLLSQASVSGSESSGDDDENLDALEASFIDDGTILESPPYQHCMYLESVKNIVGLPQKFKLKAAAQNYVDPEPVVEGCSKYLLDSFCVDDDEVAYTTSEDELEVGRKNAKINDVGKKRKRIVTFSESSSDEETFVKRIKPLDEEEHLKQMTPVSSNEHKTKFCRKMKQKFIPSSDEDGRIPSPAKCSIKEFNEKACTKSPLSVHSEAVKENDNLNDFELNCPNFSFDLEWDDAIPPSEFQGDKNNLIIMQDESKNCAMPSTSKCTINDETLVSRYQTVSAESHAFTASNNLQNFKQITNCNNNAIIMENQSKNCPVPSISKCTISDETLISRHQTASAKSHMPTAANNLQKFSDTNLVSVRNDTVSSINNLTAVSDMSCDLKSSSGNMPMATSVFSNNMTKKNDANKTILVDSRELASGKPVISALRNKYGMNPVVMQLSAADYIISNKVAVERVLDSDFPSSAIPLKIIEKVKAMSELYEKPFVIVEADNRKRSLGFNKSSTKYLQFSVHVCLHPSIKVLYSNSVDDTCNLLQSLYEKEKIKGLHINVPVALNSSSQKLYNFYNSLPHVSPVCALNFTYHFPSINRFFTSSAEELKKASSISSHKVKAIRGYLKNELLFDAFS